MCKADCCALEKRRKTGAREQRTEKWKSRPEAGQEMPHYLAWFTGFFGDFTNFHGFQRQNLKKKFFKRMRKTALLLLCEDMIINNPVQFKFVSL